VSNRSGSARGKQARTAESCPPPSSSLSNEALAKAIGTVLRQQFLPRDAALRQADAKIAELTERVKYLEKCLGIQS
jgi:hypothetical protein